MIKFSNLFLLVLSILVVLSPAFGRAQTSQASVTAKVVPLSSSDGRVIVQQLNQHNTGDAITVTKIVSSGDFYLAQYKKSGNSNGGGGQAIFQKTAGRIVMRAKGGGTIAGGTTTGAHSASAGLGAFQVPSQNANVLIHSVTTPMP